MKITKTRVLVACALLLVAVLGYRRHQRKVRFDHMVSLLEADPSVSFDARAVIRGMGEEALETLFDVLDHGPSAQRRSAAFALGQFGWKPAVTVAELVKYLKDPDPEVRIGAAWGLGSMNAGAAGAVQPLIALLKDPEAGPRMCAARAMGKIGPAASSSVGPLIGVFFHDEARMVRQWSAWSLGRISAPANQVVPPLIEAMSDPIDGVRRSAVLSIGSFEEDAKPAIPALLKGLDDPSDQVRSYSVWALGAVGPEAKEALPRLQTMAPGADGLLAVVLEGAVKRITTGAAQQPPPKS